MNETVRQANLRALGRAGLGWWVTVVALASVVGVGLMAWVHQLRHGMGSAGYNDHAFWAIYIADVVAFIGVSYGGAVVSAILRLTGATWRAPLTRLAEGAAVCTVLVGAALIVPHIGHPDRLYELVTHPNTRAPVFWDFIAVSTYTTASIIFFALPLIPDTAALLEEDAASLGPLRRRLYLAVAGGWAGTPRQRQVLSGGLTLISVVIIPLAVSVHSVLAWAFATTSRPWWHESIWAPQFVVAALYSGVALVILVVAAFRSGYGLQAFVGPRHFVRLGYIMVALGVAYLYLTFADLLPGAYVADDATSAIFGELVVGRLAGWFWLFVVAGGIVPVALVAIPWTRNIPGVVVAAALVVPMMWLKRLLMVIAPANYDVVTGDSGSYHFTWVPVAITLAALAAVPLLLMLLFRVVPILSVDELEEAQHEAGSVHSRPQQEAVVRQEPVGAASGQRPTGSVLRVGAGVVRSVALLIVLGALAAATVAGAPSAAAQTTATDPAQTELTLKGKEVDGTLTLTARVTSDKGAPVTSGTVRFLVTSTTFGVRQVPIGAVTVDKEGIAQLRVDGTHSGGYRPTTVGPTEFVASYTAQVGDPPVEYATNVDVTVARSAYVPADPKPLAGVGYYVVRGLAALVVVVWVLLLSTFARVWWVCRATAARGPVPACAPAAARPHREDAARRVGPARRPAPTPTSD